MLVLAIAAVFGRDPLYAWTGTPERHLGVITWVLFLAAFASGSRLADPAPMQRFSRWVVAAGSMLGGYAAIEHWHPLIASDANTDRLGGTYGSASLLGAALCLLLPIGVAVAIGDPHRRWRAAALGMVTLDSAALIGSGTRAAWLALCLVGFVVAVSRRRRLATHWRAVAVPALAVLIGVASSLVIASNTTERAAGAGSRLDEWRLGWGVVSHHLLLGLGPEGYRTSLADGVTAAYERTYGRAVLPDRAHNVVLDVAASGGALAALLYAALAVAVLLAGWRAIRAGSTLEVGLAGAAIAFLAQSWFLFPVATVDPVFWLIAGALTATRLTDAAQPRNDSAWRIWAVRSVAAAAMAVLFVSGLLAVSADRAARTALEAANARPANAAVARSAIDRAIALRPDVVRYRLLAASIEPHTITGLQAAIRDVQQALDVSPHDPIVLRRHADSLTRLAISTGNDEDVERARRAWAALVGDDPLCYQCQLGLGYAAALGNDPVAARDAFGAAQALEPADRREAADALTQLDRTTQGTDPDG